VHSVPERRHLAPFSSRGARRAVAVVGAAALALSMGTAIAAPSSSGASVHARSVHSLRSGKPIIFGASGGSQVAKLAQQVGVPLARHAFGHLTGKVPVGRFIDMQPDFKWRTIAGAKAGSSVYTNLLRWANTLKKRKGPLLFSFSHEPEGSASDNLGSSKDFIAAWQRVHHIFNARGVHNVEYTWTVTSNAFRVPPSDDRSASKWYPGSAFVDNVGAGAYNWHGCGSGASQWLPLSNRAAGPLAFARSKHKQLVLAEWASQSGPRRVQWLKDARAWFLANKGSIRGAFYYQNSTHTPGCHWALTSSADVKAFAAMARDRTHFGS
jgi:hypothetical protein